MQAKMFGVGYNIRLAACGLQPIWSPEQMAALHLTLDKVYGHGEHPNELARTRCHFGHETHSVHRQRLLPKWRGAPFNALLCTTCFNIERREFDAPGVNVHWLATVPPPTAHAPRRGHCFRGHLTSSSQGSSGRQAWQLMPNGIVWNGVPSGSTLCQACYLKAWRYGKPASSTSGDRSV